MKTQGALNNQVIIIPNSVLHQSIHIAYSYIYSYTIYVLHRRSGNSMVFVETHARLA